MPNEIDSNRAIFERTEDFLHVGLINADTEVIRLWQMRSQIYNIADKLPEKSSSNSV